MVAAPGIAAFGRTLESARMDVVDQLSRQLGRYPGAISVEDLVELPAASEKALATARAARNSALEAAAASQAATATAVLELTEQGLSLRDCGYLLGLSHGRVRQILTAAGTRKRAPGRRDQGKSRQQQTPTTGDRS